MAEGTAVSLQEFEVLTQVFQVVPHKSHKGLFTQQDIEWTCLDVSKDFIALGTNHGMVYLYDRFKKNIQKLQCPIKGSVISFVKMQQSIDYVVGMATTTGLLYIFVLPSVLPGRNKQLQMFTVQGLHHSSIRFIEWSQNAMKLFSGDEDGVVICTELDYEQFKSTSYLVCKEPHSVVQLSYAYKTLLVSTRFRTFLIQPGDFNSIVQVGQKDRKVLGAFGAVFLPGVYQPKDAVLFAARPGLRLWKANMEGVVEATYIFRELLTEHHSGLCLLAETTRDVTLPETNDQQFGPLLMYEDTKLVTLYLNSLYVIDPGLGSFVAYHCNLGPIQDVAVCEDEIFVLRSSPGRVLLRIAQKPLPGSPQTLPVSSETGPTAAPGTDPYDPNSPVHLLSVTASKMSNSIIGAFKDIGEKVSAVQEGQKQETKPPPWGSASVGHEESPAKTAIQRVDSAKEPSPETELPEESAQAATSAEVETVTITREEEHVPPGAPPIVKLEGNDLLKIQLTSDPTSDTNSNQSSPAVDRKATSSSEKREDRLHKFETLGQQSFDDIVFSSSTKVKKHKKKKHKSNKDKDSLSVASLEINDPRGDASPRSSRGASPVSVASREPSPQPVRDVLPLARDVLEPADPVKRNDAISKQTECTVQTSESSHQQVADVEKSQSSSRVAASVENSETLTEGIKSGQGSDIVEGKRGETIKDSSIQRGDNSEPHIPAVPDNSASCGAQTQVDGASSDGPGQKNNQSLKMDTAGKVTAQSLDQTDLAPASVDRGDKAQGKGDKVQDGVKNSESKEPNVNIPDKVLDSPTPAIPKGDTSSSAQATPVATTTHPLSDSSLSPSEDFYSMYSSHAAPSPRPPKDPYSGGFSIQDAMDSSSTNRGRSWSKNSSHGSSDSGSLPQDTQYTLLDTWGEFPAPGALQSFCLTERTIWCTDRAENLYYSSLADATLKWKKVEKAPAKQISASRSGWVVWRLHKDTIYVGTKLTTNKISTKTKWMDVAKEVAYISVDETYAWYAKQNGDVFMQKGLSRDRPCYRSLKVACPHRIQQVVCRSGVVWALTEDRNLLVRTGIQPGKEEGTDWKFLQGGGPSLLVSNFDIGDGNTAWVIDLVGRVWFTTSVTRTVPEGSGQWWQVPMSEYLMHDSKALDVLKTVTKIPQNLVKLVQSQDQGGLISARENGVWVCPGHRTTLHVCRSNMLGHQWELATPQGMLPSSTWSLISATAAEENEGLIWAQQPNGEIFSYTAGSLRPTQVIPPKPGVAFLSLSATEEAVWGVLPGGVVTVRFGMAPHCLHGLRWEALDLAQLGSAKLVHVNCGIQNVWGVDSKGNVYMRIGVKPALCQHLNPAWVPVEGTTHTLGAKFVQVYCGPNDWMVWALDNKKSLYVRKGITDAMPIGTHWVLVSGSQLEMVAVSEQLVYGLTPSGELLVRYGITPENPAGNYWRMVPGAVSKISVTAGDFLWGINKDGQLCRRHVYFLKRRDSLPGLDKSQLPLDSLDDDWELI